MERYIEWYSHVWADVFSAIFSLDYIIDVFVVYIRVSFARFNCMIYHCFSHNIYIVLCVCVEMMITRRTGEEAILGETTSALCAQKYFL